MTYKISILENAENDLVWYRKMIRTVMLSVLIW